ncbi:SOS response-associated peptidase [Faecalispora sporosphaeroides]|uniref:SOS response-associated peptidase n=1 Tax=Faecalispora sporosphaeroides TaxID=1549 RepID=UPI000366484C|nr:SOS response-associated peptidase [Faecalispora sporosphaeroides]
MCGRYVLFSDPEMAEIREIIEEVQKNNPVIKTGEIFPTNSAPVLLQEDGKLTPHAVKWGFPDFRSKGVIINARGETAPEKPMFRKSFETRRCIIPSCGFFEWSHHGQKTKYQFNLPGESALYMAGLYNDFDGDRRFVILTTAPNESMQEIHNRMPVVLTHPEMDQWIGSYQGALDILQSIRPELVKQLA